MCGEVSRVGQATAPAHHLADLVGLRSAGPTLRIHVLARRDRIAHILDTNSPGNYTHNPSDDVCDRFMNERVFMLRFILIVGFVLFGFAVAAAQPKVYRDRVEPQWFSNDQKFWYRVDQKDGGREFVVVDAMAGSRSAAFDHAVVATKLTELLEKPVSAIALPIDKLEFSQDSAFVVLSGREGRFQLDPTSGELTRVEATTTGGGTQLELPAEPSKDSTDETEIVVSNNLPTVVSLFWVDANRNQRGYGTIEPGQTHRQHTFAEHVWLFKHANGDEIGSIRAVSGGMNVTLDDISIANVRRSDAPRRRRRRESADVIPVSKSPDGLSEAFVRDQNLWLRTLSDNTETPLTTDADATHTMRRDASRERAIGMAYDKPDYPDNVPDVVWSPDSRTLLAFQTTTVDERRVYYVESSPSDQVQPKLQSYPYLKPGDAIPVSKPRLFDVTSGKEIPIANDLFPNPWSLEFQRWSDDGTRFWLLYNERGHQRMRVLEVLTATGDVRAIVDESSDTFIHYSSDGKMELRWLKDDRLLWASERTGWNHLYRYDTASGTLLNAVTSGDWNVRRIEHIDEESGQVWFFAVGLNAGQDPYHEHFCRVNLDGSGFVQLTSGDGTHAIEWSPDKRWLIDRYSRIDLPPVTELRSAEDGALVCRLEAADASEIIAARGELPERFVAKGRDGTTDIWGIIHRPKDFDPSRSYAVIEYIYAGPHDHHVPKEFRASFGHQHAIADRGFIVVQIDGMGTAWRSKAFHDVCFKNLKDAGFPDRIAWMKAAKEKIPQMDLTRVGIYGGSAGGQNAMGALVWHGDFYKVAVADCGCHDNRMDKIWWNEQWMGVPEGDVYADNSNMEHAGQLQGHLMLVVGELDRNVDPATTMQVAKRLVDAGKEFDLVVVPGAGHGSCETPWGSRRRLKFFETHLGTLP